MAVLRALTSNSSYSIFFNRKGKYFKEFDPAGLSEGRLHYQNNNNLQNPSGYLSIVAHFILPQIKQRNVAAFWLFHYLYIYSGVALKSLICRSSSFKLTLFLSGYGIIVRGYMISLMT